MTALALMAGSLFGYYPWLRYNTRNAPFTGVPSKFDLAQLPGKTVYFYISESGSAALLPGDSPAALYSQIRAAARVWNDVDTSDIRIAYGGVRPAGFVAGNTPSIDVGFEDLPPGVLSQGGPVVVDDDGPGAQQTFLPFSVRRWSFLAISPRCLAVPVPFLEASISSQRPFTSSATPWDCSIVSRAASCRRLSRVAPPRQSLLAADDAAGISFLYPTRAFAANFGSIAGRVTAGGAPVAYASVVAFRAPARLSVH